MLNSIVLFSNLFRSKDITPERLYSFGLSVLQALLLANDDKQFDAIIAQLSNALAALKKEISGVAISLNSQKTETEGVDDFIVSFYRFMSENESFIAKQLGGRKSAGFREFYPFGQTEYSKATKTEMPLLTARIKYVATKFQKKLEPELCRSLQAFSSDYEALQASQQRQIQLVKSERNGRKNAFVNTQLVLSQAVHAVGLQYPGNVEKCSSFFPFDLLYTHNKRESITKEGSLAKDATENLLNRQLLKSAVIKVKNLASNASFAVWSATLPEAPMPADAVVVNAAGKGATIQVATLGNSETNTFYMIRNLSSVNDCSYKVTFIGLKKKKEKKAPVAKDAAKMKEMSA